MNKWITLSNSANVKKLLSLDSSLNWKKLDLTTALICLSNLRAESKITTKFVTEGLT